MKRDMDLIRDILLHAEEHSKPMRFSVITQETFPDAESFDHVVAHIRLLEDEGLIDPRSKVMGQTRLGELSWAGHDFVGVVRDPEIWKQTKAAGEKAGGWTLGILGDLAKGLIKTKIAKHTGVEL